MKKFLTLAVLVCLTLAFFAGRTALAEGTGYTVEFTRDGLEYVLPGDTYVAMSEILSTLGLTGEVTAVEISDTSLFSASNETGEWIVTAHQAFSTTEWMKVTINDVVYEIAVTDDPETVSVTYVDANGETQTCASATILTGSSTSLSAGWYVVNENVTIADRISVSGTVNLILGNGATLTASKGITVGSDATLNIYAQSDDEATMGALVADATNDNANWYAGIGGVENADAGTITINGGQINTYGWCAAGIGSGGGTSTVGTITINGGVVTAQDNAHYGAGIGGGFSGGKASTINLNGGVIHAAGIGSGWLGGDCSITVNISDGVKKIVATPVQGGACIGSGKDANGSVTVNFKSGGNTVTGDAKDAVFYDSGEGSERRIYDKASSHTVTVNNDLKANITSDKEYALTGETVTLTLDTSVDATTLKVNDGAVSTTDAGNRQYTFTMPDGNVTVTATLLQTYAVTLPANMVVVSATNAADADGKYITGTAVTFKASFPYAVSNVSDGTNTLTATDGVYIVTIGSADITVTADFERSNPINLSDAPGNFTAIAGDVLTGSTSHTLTIVDGASITLSSATITGGIVCEGSATITLVGTNSVSVVQYNKAGIQIGGSGTTLTIHGSGSLTATGGSAAAGIGLGRTWDASVTAGAIVIEGGTVTASGDIGIGIGKVGNSQTAAIDGISIKGGTVNASLGKGYIYNGSTATVGYIKIYDGIEMVDASKITETVTYMHVDGETETDVTDSKTDYFTIGEDGDRRIISPKDDTDYTITIADGIEHGTLTAAATAKYMQTVTVTATPAFGYRFVRLVVKDADNNDVASTNNTFLMPKSNVTVSAEFEQGTHGTTEFVWGYPGPDSFVNEATIYDGVTTVNIQQTEQSYNILKYEGYTYSKFLLDNNTYDANIPYAGGTGEFYGAGNGTNFAFDYDRQTGYYDITLTDVGNGKWGVSILPTPAQMDVVPDQTYTGSAITPEPLVIAGSLSLTKGTDYVYSYTNNTDVGTATVRATFLGDYESLGYVEQTFTIGKATPTVTAPTPIENLVYTGSAQTLVTAGSADFGTLLYSLDGTTYAADIPTATDTGDYTVYYKVEASDNWNAVDAASVAVTIIPRTYTVNFDANGGEGTMEPMQLTYNGEWTALTANTFTRTGYGFKGWNTEAGGTGTDYNDEGWVRNLTTEVSIVLYAQWGEDIAKCTATVPDQTMGSYSYIFYKFEAANSNATLAAEMGVVVKDGDDVLTLGTDYEFGNVTFADGSEGMPANVGDECLLEIKGKGNYAGSLWAPFTITVADANGTWGDLAWTFHAGTLTVSGTGAMDAASDYSGYPWFRVASCVTAITIGEGVTSVADAAFGGTSNVNPYGKVTSVTLPTTLTTIGEDAFAYMTALESIDLTHVTAIGGAAFNQCASLTAIVPATVISMGSGAFAGCKSVTCAVVIGSMENGTVTASPTSAAKDATITLTATPNTGYMLESFTVTALDGRTITVNNNQFTMPDYNVTVTATFKEIPKFTITFEAGEGTGDMAPESVDSGANYTLPACGFTAPENKIFKEWSVVIGTAEAVTKAPDEAITVTADTTVTAVWEETDPKIVQNTLELAAVLNLKYYLQIPQGFDGTGASMSFSLNGQIVSFSSAEQSGGYYVFPCRVYAYQMAEPITATFTWQEMGETKTLTDTYSVKQYLDALAADANTNTKTLALVKAVQNYGHYLQPYLARINGLTYTEMPKAADTDVNVSTAAAGSAEEANAIAHNTTMDGSKITNLQIRLNINSGTDLMFEFKLADGVSGTVTAKAGDGEFAEITPNGNGVYRVSKQTIAANNLECAYTFQVKVGDDTALTTTASVMDYISIVLQNSTAEDEKSALAALYEYWAAADTY